MNIKIKFRSTLAAFTLGCMFCLQNVPTTVIAAPIEAAFSPDEGAETLVVRAIDSSRHSIRLAAYSFTLPTVVESLVRAHHRGVDVRLVVDYKDNIAEDRSGKARAALNALVAAGIPVRTVRVWPIFHDKFFCVDGSTLETGSFNFSSAAAHKNSENVIVLWNEPATVRLYEGHWERSWSAGEPYTPNY